MPASEWSTRWAQTDAHGRTLPPERLPLMEALTERRPAQASFFIEGPDGRRRHITVTAFPLLRAADHVLGAVALFWESA